MWHDYPADIDLDAQLVIILGVGIDFEDPKSLGYKNTDMFSGWGSQQGLLATCHGSIDGVNIVKTTVHRHRYVTIVRISEAKDDIRNSRKRYADRIATKHPDVIEKVREDDLALKELVASCVTDSLLKDTETLKLTMAINIRGGWRDSSTLALDDCIGVIKLLLQCGSCYIVKSEDNTTWCVD